MQDHDLARAAALLCRGQVVVLTGAGISVDSGIPDFRSPGGLWERYPVEEYATLDAFLESPRKVWALFAEIGATLSAARPNPGHEAIARLEALGLVRAVITQNVDGLHQAAGSRDVIEFHGSATRLRCLGCGKVTPAPAGPARDPSDVPTCPCGEVLKPDVILFGEMIPPDALIRSRRLAAASRACLVCGTSGLVFPAAAIPDDAAAAGAGVVEVNLEPTALTSRLGGVFLRGSTSRVLPVLVAQVEAALSRHVKGKGGPRP